MRRAEWRRRADDPTGPFGWWWRSVVERRRTFLTFLPFGVCAAIGLAEGGWGWFLLALANAAFVSGQASRKVDRLAPLLPQPPPPGQFRASVAYERQDVVTGTDEMALVVVEGWLYAEGTRSHFAVRREHLRGLWTGSDHRGWLLLLDGSKIQLSDVDSAARIILERWWQAKAFGEGEGEPTLPPSRVHPQELARWGSNVVAAVLLCGIGTFVHLGGWLGFMLRQWSWTVGLILLLFAARRGWGLFKIHAFEEAREGRGALEGEGARSPLHPQPRFSGEE